MNKVCIRCITYNHAPYIEDAMNGFCMQQTTFPFVAIIVDDASPDGEPEIIKAYLNIHFDMQNARQWETDDAHFIEVRHKENLNCVFAVVLLKYNVRQAKKKNLLITEWLDTAEYIAICEGDDYWIKPEKLQKQVDFLDSHPDYGLTYTNIETYHQKDGVKKKGWCRQADFRELLLQDYICTLTTCFRKDLYNRYFNEVDINPNWKMGDYPLWLYIINQAKIHYFEEIMGVYRFLEESASHTKDVNKRVAFVKSAFDVRYYFAKKYHATDMCKAIAKREIKTYIDISLAADTTIDYHWLQLSLRYGITDIKLLFMAFSAKYSLGRKFLRYFHSLRIAL